MADELEGRQIQGAQLETFRDPKTRIIRVLGAGFWVVVEESGAVAIHYADRTIHVALDSEPVVEPKPMHDNDAQSPRSDPVPQRRGAR